MRELKVWEPLCGVCLRSGSVIFAEYKPAPPEGWGYETLHDCGMTGYTKHELLCDRCIRKRLEMGRTVEVVGRVERTTVDA